MYFFPITKTKVKAVISVVMMAVIAMSTPVSAQTVDNLKDKQAELQKKIEQIQKQINSYQGQINQTRKQQASLKNEISIYDNQIASLELQIQANETLTEDTSLQIKELEDQINRRQAEIADNKKILGQLIVQLNELDSNSWLYIGLGTDDFSKFLDQVQYTENVQGKVFQILQNIKTIKAKLEAQQADLKTQLVKLEELREQLGISQQALDSERVQKEKLLTQTRGVESNYQKLLNASKSEQDKLQKEISDLDDSIRAKLGNRTLVAKGVLANPMAGVRTQGYGNTGFTSLGYSFHNGIDLAAPAGTPIYAAADGTVSHCGSGEAAYGNWCTIKHTISTKSGSRCIVTLYAHMRSMKVRSGQKVAQGDIVGYEGNTGNTTRLLYGPDRGYHLHFTVFDCEGYGVSPGAYSKIYGPYSVPYGYTYNPLDFLGR